MDNAMNFSRNDNQTEHVFFRKTYSGKNRFESGPFSAPVFIDLALLIILFFITIHFSELIVRPGIKLELPSSKFQDGGHYDRFDTVLITLSREGMVFFNDELTTLAGLESAIARAGHSDRDTSILIQADASIDYGTIIRIFNMGAQAGIEDVTLATSIAQEAVLEQ